MLSGRIRLIVSALAVSLLVAGSLLTASPAAAATATIPVGSTPSDIALSPDGSTAYVADSGSGTVSVIDTATGAVTATIPGVGYPYAVAVSPDGSTVYVTDGSMNALYVIAAASLSVTRTITVGDLPLPLMDIALSPDGSTAYVAALMQLSVIDLTTGAVTADIPVGMGALSVAVAPDGSKAYVTLNDPGATEGVVTVVDLATEQIDTIEVGEMPYAVAVSPDGARVYVTDEALGVVSVIDTADDSVADTIGVGDGPFAVAFDPGGTIAYVSNFFDGTVSAIDVGTSTVVATLPGGISSWGIAVAPDGDRVYVVDSDGDAVSQIIEDFGRRASVSISGSGVAGESLTASVTDGALPVPAGYRYQWSADGSEIAGATGATFTPGAERIGQRIAVRAIPALVGYGSGSGASTSEELTIVPATILAGSPAISGDETVGSVLTADPGSWSPAGATLSYQWYRAAGDAEPTTIDGATGASYTVTGADVYMTLTVRVTGSLTGSESVAATSGPTGMVPPATLPGTAQEPVASTPESTIVAGGTVAVSGEHFDADPTVNVWLHSTPILLGTLPVHGDGTVSGTVTLPASLAEGSHHIVLVGTATGYRATTSELTAGPDDDSGDDAGDDADDDSQLASTGSDVAPLAGASGLALLLGIVLLASSRRRTPGRWNSM